MYAVVANQVCRGPIILDLKFYHYMNSEKR